MSPQAQRGYGYIAPTHSQLRCQGGLWSATNPAALPPRKNRYKLHSRPEKLGASLERHGNSRRPRNSISGRPRPQRVTILSTLSKLLPDTTESKFQRYAGSHGDTAAGSSDTAIRDYTEICHFNCIQKYTVSSQIKNWILALNEIFTSKIHLKGTGVSENVIFLFFCYHELHKQNRIIFCSCVPAMHFSFQKPPNWFPLNICYMCVQ
jgi:hypothetical protein